MKPDTTPRICRIFAERLYKACDSSELPDRKDFYKCKKVEDTWEDAESFIVDGLGYDYEDSITTTDNCFNAAGLAQPIVALVVLCVGAFIRL